MFIILKKPDANLTVAVASWDSSRDVHQRVVMAEFKDLPFISAPEVRIPVYAVTLTTFWPTLIERLPSFWTAATHSFTRIYLAIGSEHKRYA